MSTHREAEKRGNEEWALRSKRMERMSSAQAVERDIYNQEQKKKKKKKNKKKKKGSISTLSKDTREERGIRVKKYVNEKKGEKMMNGHV